MSDVTAVVSKGFEFVADALGRFRITRTRLNLLGVPGVVVPLDDSVDLEDITGDLADLIPKVSISVAAEDSDAISVTIQALDARGNNLADEVLVRCWLSDTALAAETGTAPNTSFAPTTGTLVETVTAKKHLIVLTNSSGVAVVKVDNAGGSTHSWYLNVVVANKVFSSGVITITI